MNINLCNKRVLITGATRGIGKSISDLFSDAGADLILTGTNKKIINEFNSLGKNSSAKWIQADFSTDKGIYYFNEEINKFNRIDICINNAGINIIKP